MADYTGSLDPLSGSGGVDAAGSPLATLSAVGTFVIQGLEVVRLPSSLYHVARYVGEKNIPHDIARQRRYVYEIMRRMGQPVVIKHMYNHDDVLSGIAEESPNFNSVYGQVRNEDPLSYGIGFVSKEKSEDEWIAPDGSIVRADEAPDPTWAQAPRYRGFGPGYLTYIIEPDVAEDFFKLSPTGALIKVQEANAQAPWWPDVNDNDLIINVTLDRHMNITANNERYQAKLTNPVSMRGLDRNGRREYAGDSGNRHVINQTFPMTLVPTNNILMKVDLDR